MKDIRTKIFESFEAQKKAASELRAVITKAAGKRLPKGFSASDAFGVVGRNNVTLTASLTDTSEMEEFIKHLESKGWKGYVKAPKSGNKAEVREWVFDTKDYSVKTLALEKVSYPNGMAHYTFYYAK